MLLSTTMLLFNHPCRLCLSVSHPIRSVVEHVRTGCILDNDAFFASTCRLRQRSEQACVGIHICTNAGRKEDT